MLFVHSSRSRHHRNGPSTGLRGLAAILALAFLLGMQWASLVHHHARGCESACDVAIGATAGPNCADQLRGGAASDSSGLCLLCSFWSHTAQQVMSVSSAGILIQDLSQPAGILPELAPLAAGQHGSLGSRAPPASTS